MRTSSDSKLRNAGKNNMSAHVMWLWETSSLQHDFIGKCMTALRNADFDAVLKLGYEMFSISKVIWKNIGHLY